MSLNDNELNKELHKKQIQFFKFAQAFSKLVNKPISDIDASKNYQNIWLNDIPKNDLFHNAIFKQNKNYWLKFKS